MYERKLRALDLVGLLTRLLDPKLDTTSELACRISLEHKERANEELGTLITSFDGAPAL